METPRAFTRYCEACGDLFEAADPAVEEVPDFEATPWTNGHKALIHWQHVQARDSRGCVLDVGRHCGPVAPLTTEPESDTVTPNSQS